MVTHRDRRTHTLSTVLSPHVGEGNNISISSELHNDSDTQSSETSHFTSATAGSGPFRRSFRLHAYFLLPSFIQLSTDCHRVSGRMYHSW